METNANHPKINRKEQEAGEELEKLKYIQDHYLKSLSQDQIKQYNAMTNTEKLISLAKFQEKEDQYTMEKSRQLGIKSENFSDLDALIKKYLRTLPDKDIKRLKSHLVKVAKIVDEQIETNIRKEKENEEKKLALEIERLEKQLASKKEKLNFHL